MSTTQEMVYKELAKKGCKNCLSTGRIGFRAGIPIPCHCAKAEHRRLESFAKALPNVPMDPIELIRAAKAAAEIAEVSV